MASINRVIRPSAYRMSARTPRSYSTEPPKPQYEQPTPQQTRSNPHREFYRGGAGRAVMFNFLIAMATFQAIYWGWMKLESMEIKQQKQSEIKTLEGELKSLSEKADEKARSLVGAGGQEGAKYGKKKGWFGW